MIRYCVPIHILLTQARARARASLSGRPVFTSLFNRPPPCVYGSWITNVHTIVHKRRVIHIIRTHTHTLYNICIYEKIYMYIYTVKDDFRLVFLFFRFRFRVAHIHFVRRGCVVSNRNEERKRSFYPPPYLPTPLLKSWYKLLPPHWGLFYLFRLKKNTIPPTHHDNNEYVCRI